MTPETRALIEQLLTIHACAEVPGHVRQKSGAIVSYEACVAIYREIALTKLGRQKIGGDGGGHYKPRPVDFEEYAPLEHNPALMRRYDVKVTLISRWRRETGIKPPEHRIAPRVRRCIIPDGFAEMARQSNDTWLADKFGVARHTVKRWRETLGISATRIVPFKQNTYTTTPIDRPHRDDSRAGQAADYLRRFGPVVRCDHNGRYSERGKFWRRGSTVLFPDDVIERAIRNGWNPDSWRIMA